MPDGRFYPNRDLTPDHYIKLCYIGDESVNFDDAYVYNILCPNQVEYILIFIATSYSGLGSYRDWGKIAHQALIFLWGIYQDK